MATVQAALALYDGMTQPLRSIHRALEIVLNTFEAMQMASSRSIDMHSIQEVREELARAGVSLNQVQVKVNRASLEQQSFNQHIRDGTSAADSLARKFKAILATVLSIAGIKMAINWVIDNLKLSDIQRNAERQLQVVLNNIAAEEAAVPISVDLQVSDAQINSAFDRITDKASEIQSRGMFGDEAMIAGAAELATYFSDENAIMSMMDTLADYAAGMSQGREVDYKQMTDYATNLGKLTNGNYTAVTQKGFEISDAQKAIIEGTATQAQIVETLGAEYLNMSRDMQAAAAINQVIGERWAGMYEAMSNTPSGKIVQMKNAFGDVREEIGDRLYPAVLQFVDVFNSRLPQVAGTLGLLAGACSALIVVLTALFNLAVSVGGAIADNWDILGPVILGAAAALGVYWTVTKGVTLALKFAEKAALAWDAAMAMSPVAWVVIGVIALIAAITALCAWFVRGSDVAQSAFGVMAGGINVVIQFLGNLLAAVGNVCLGLGAGFVVLVYNMVTAFSNGIANIRGFFWDLLSDALSVISGICEALNNLPFIEFDYSGVSAKAEEFADKSAAAYNSKTEYADLGEAMSTGFNTFEVFKDGWGWVSDAFAAGAAWGDGISNKFKLTALEDSFNFDLEDKISGIYDNAADTAANTAATADALDYAQEDLQFLRDIAEREAINRYTTAEIKVEQHNTNYIDKGGDLDGIMDAWASDFAERLDMSAEGVDV